MQLHEIQQSMMAFLRDGSGNFRDVIVDTGCIGVEQRLHIYHHAYRARLVEVMQDVFERTWAYLGDDGFERSARRFIEETHSSARTLNRFGESFPAWLQQDYPNDGEVAEVAMIDWLLRCAFDGANASPLQLADLAALPGEEWTTVGFDFHPTLALVPITFNAASIWEALENRVPPTGPEKLAVPTFLVVWRRDCQPHFKTINGLEAAAVNLLRQGESFAKVCDTLEARYVDDNIVTKLGESLRRWIDDEMLVSIRPRT